MKKSRFSGVFIKKPFFFFVLVFLLGGAFLASPHYSSNSATSQSVEVGFTSLSPAGSSGGEIIPASCASGYVPHPATGDSDCDFFSFSVDSSSVAFNTGTYLRWNIHENFWNGWGQLQWCRAEGDWSGDKSVRNGVEYTGNLTPANSTKTYSLRCRVMMVEDGNMLEKVKTVYVNVGAAPNNPPNAPTISGPTSGVPGYHSFTFTASDPDGHNVYIGIDWDYNGSVDQWLGPAASGSGQITNRYFSPDNVYSFRALAQDIAGANSGWTTHTITIATPNNGPGAPIINGQSCGGSTTAYPGNQNVSFYATDPDNDTIAYYIDWDMNGTIDQYLPASGFVASGTTLTTTRNFSSLGNNTFRAYTQDSRGIGSGWCTHTMQIIPVPCVPNCNRDSQVCQGERYTDANNCAANNCTGTRVCDFNWKEVAP